MLRPQLCGTNVKHTLWRPKVMVLPRADVQIARKSSAMPSEHPVPYERVSAKRKSKADGVQHKVDGPSIRGATHLSFSIATARRAGGNQRPVRLSDRYSIRLPYRFTAQIRARSSAVSGLRAARSAALRATRLAASRTDTGGPSSLPNTRPFSLAGNPV
jgi:hypothetical protein